LQIKEELDDVDTLSMSVAVDFDKLDRVSEKMKAKLNRQYVFVTEDGKTASNFEDQYGKIIWKKR
jgi:hypothetical protein